MCVSRLPSAALGPTQYQNSFLQANDENKNPLELFQGAQRSTIFAQKFLGPSEKASRSGWPLRNAAWMDAR